jgi:hypothetical protein
VNVYHSPNENASLYHTPDDDTTPRPPTATTSQLSSKNQASDSLYKGVSFPGSGKDGVCTANDAGVCGFGVRSGSLRA